MASSKEEGIRSQDVRDITKLNWWTQDVEKAIRPYTRDMLEKYSAIPPEELVKHIEETRKKAWDLAPFASVGSLTWLNSYMLMHLAYDTILTRVKNSATILDCGCMIGPDLRQLAYDGCPTENMYGFDIEPGFFDIGYDFYRDRSTFKGTFLQADGLAPIDQSPLREVKGKVDVVWAPKILHLWDRPTQIKTAAAWIALLKPQKRSMFVGSQNGLPSPNLVTVSGSENRSPCSLWLGNAETIREDWDEVATLTGTRWEFESQLLDMRTIGMHDDDGSPYKKMTGYNLQWAATLVEPPLSAKHSE